ncbi:DUF4185 domain-containing protein [Actinopolymorpha sp. B11F2]|uniref:DUF4185 domain-containing protein n=1 Tax=Actinopolymorpha sp. B11F2 TaxID=3160862 RepID=UPI0032E42758
MRRYGSKRRLRSRNTLARPAVATVLGASVALLLAVPPAGAAARSVGGAPGTGETARTAGGAAGRSCALPGKQWTATAEIDEGRTQRFADYGNSGVGWTGGDSTYSVPLTSGRTLWLFSDTFWGPVNDDLSRPTTVPFLNNSFVVEHGDELTTVSGGTPDAPESLVPPDEPDTWNWLGAGTVTPSSLDVMFLEYGRTGPEPWDFAWRENKLGRFDPDRLTLRELVPMPSAAGVQWASWLQRVGGYTYIYGVEDLGATKYMHLARVKGGDVAAGPWSYWTGSGWSATETDTARIMPGVANEYSVAPFRDGYLVITQDTTELFSRNIVAYVGCSPSGPFTRATTVYVTPETGAGGSYGNPNIITYNAHEHPDLRSGDRLLVTYNVNSLDPNADLYDDVTIYRPRFVEVTLSSG